MDIAQIKQKIIDDSLLIFKDELIERDFTLSYLPQKANVITGARRTGKTSELRMIARDFIAKGTDKSKICYMTFFEDSFIGSDITVSQIEKAYYEMHPEYYNDNEVVFLFDEIQVLKNWGAGITSLMDRHPVKVILTGSSAKYLSFDIATELRGRALSDHFYPLSFTEFMKFSRTNIEPKEVYSSEEESIIRKMFNLYLERGAYPELANINDKILRNKILSTYFDLMFSRDLIERFDIAKAGELRILMRRILKTSTTPQSLKRLEHSLSSIGYKLSAPTISSYLTMMEEAAIITKVNMFGNEKIQKANPMKCYAVDHALVKYLNEFSSMKGVMEEIIVFSHLQRLNRKIFYYRTSNDYEVDFLLSDEDLTPLLAVQVTDNFPISKEREIRGMYHTMNELDLNEGYILTSDSEEEIREESKTIKVLPIWKFLMHMSNYGK